VCGRDWTIEPVNSPLVLAEGERLLSLSDFLKAATPRMEGDRRFIFMEASNEKQDQQEEVILAKALADSAQFFLEFGNIDLDHYTVIGPRLGIPNYLAYEIGRPVDVRVAGKQSFVKAEIFTGSGPMIEKANEFWSSITELRPPQRWYPSVGGRSMPGGRVADFDPKTQTTRTIIKAVKWFNIGLSKTPVNDHVPTVSSAPFGVFAKSWAAAGFDFSKALEAGYGTDAATLTGGAAMRKQSLDGSMHYLHARDKLAEDLLTKKLGEDPSLEDLVAHASREYEMDDDESSDFVERFMRDLRRDGTNKPLIH
jgi:hypothetical protein